MATRFNRTTLGANDDGRRLDRVLRKALPNVPLSRIHRALRTREITVNGGRVRADTRVAEGDTLEIAETVTASGIARSEESGSGRPTVDRSRPPRPSGPPLEQRVVHEDDDLLVVAKLRGELTHGRASLEDRVRAYLTGRLASGVSYRPGPVHRLDRNTSGLVIFGVSLHGAQAATEALQSGAVTKRYVALLDGEVTATTWHDTLERDRSAKTTIVRHRQTNEGRNAVTHVEPVASNGSTTVALVTIETGRTHQIRAQAAHHGHPLTGDRKYGSAAPGPYYLHAASLTATSLSFSHVWSDLPGPFERRLRGFYDESVLAEVRARIRSAP